ncbi:MAG TPA: ABC transporter permease, partial [Acidimicrobiia bacterium]|nr:ABC transporter permease [Acidimicrobiia bacterium]
FPLLLAGRIVAVTMLGGIAFGEAWAVATIGFGLDVEVHHPAAFAVAALATGFALSGWATVLSAVLVLSGSARFLQNTMTFPLYVLSGVLVPVALLPVPFRWLSRVVFLSWGADLLRDAYGPSDLAALPHRVVVLVGLGSAGFVLGNGLLVRAIQALRSSGRLGLT